MTSLSKMASILKRKIGHNIQPQKEITDPKPNSVVIIDVIDKRLITRVMSYFQNAIEHANARSNRLFWWTVGYSYCDHGEYDLDNRVKFIEWIINELKKEQ